MIDDVNLPTAIIHILYADFREWRNPNAYRTAFLEVLRALNVEPRLFGRTDLIWYARNTSYVRNIQRILRVNLGMLAGGRYDGVATTNYHSLAIKYALWESNTFESLSNCTLSCSQI